MKILAFILNLNNKNIKKLYNLIVEFDMENINNIKSISNKNNNISPEMVVILPNVLVSIFKV